MKSKKLISLLCAATLTASTFAAFAVTANAATGDSLLGKDTTLVQKVDFESATAGTPSQAVAHYEFVNEVAQNTSADAYKDEDWSGQNWGAGLSTRGNNPYLAEASGYYGNLTDAGDYFADIMGTQLVDKKIWTNVYKKPTVTAPSVTGTKSLYFATKQGASATSTFTIAPAIETSSTNVYKINFDMMLMKSVQWERDATQHDADPDPTKSGYEIKFTDGTNEVIKFAVDNETLSYYDGSTKTVTSITDLPVAGKWFNFDILADYTQKRYKVTIKAYDGDNLASTATAEIPWATFASSSAGKIKQFAGAATGSGRDRGAVNCAIDNFVVQEAESVVTKNVTINFKSGATAIKDPVTVQVETGSDFTANADYKVPFTTDALRTAEKYYKYDTTSTDTLTNVQANSEITLNFTETAMPTTTIKAVTGANGSVELGTLESAKVVPGEKVEVLTHEYAQFNDKWYQKVAVNTAPRNNKNYLASTTGTEEDSVFKVEYTPAFDVIFFREIEDYESVLETDVGTDSNKTFVVYGDNYPANGASGGHRGHRAVGNKYPEGFKTTGVENAGTYEITIAGYDSSGKSGVAVSTLSSGTAEISHAEKIGEVAVEGLFTKSFTADLAAGGIFYVGKCDAANVASSTNGLNCPLDYIVVKDVNADAAPVPAVTIGDVDTTAATAALTLTNAAEFAALGITPKVTLIQAVYDGTALSDVKIWNNVGIDPATGTATATITGAAAGASVFYVWDAVGGVRPLGEAKPITVSTPE